MTDKFPPCFYRVSAKALIFKDKKVLLVKEADGRWEFPGGGLEIGEPFASGIGREIGEEIGVNVIKTSPQPVYTWTLVDNGKPKLILCFKVEIDSDKFKYDPEESVEIGFFSKEEMEKMNLHVNIQELPNKLE